MRYLTPTVAAGLLGSALALPVLSGCATDLNTPSAGGVTRAQVLAERDEVLRTSVWDDKNNAWVPKGSPSPMSLNPTPPR